MDQEIDLFSLQPKQQNELTVSEISQRIKFLVEKNFTNVRIKGEISGYKTAPSGHAYFSLKDSNSVLSAVCWNSNIAKLKCTPEEGLEVICSGTITTYSGQSKYQLIVSSMEISGVGTLMALLEKRKRQFIAEGLFSPENKKPLPKFPRKIGVVTSITGSVIQDIIHRISDRFPTNILIWPVLVQGAESSEQITNAINGFNRLSPSKKPDVIIVARGGGSIEDLWPFNEENVVRAIFNSSIPIISAVGHETDYTLSDFAADVRAPTPTAAAEISVPVKQDLLFSLADYKHRINNLLKKQLHQSHLDFSNAKRLTPKIKRSIYEFEQKIDDIYDKLFSACKNHMNNKRHTAEILSSSIIHPSKYLSMMNNKLIISYERFCNILNRDIQKKEKRFFEYKYSINLKNAKNRITQNYQHLRVAQNNFVHFLQTKLSEKEFSLQTTSSILESLDYQRTLNRGFSVVKHSNNQRVVKSIKDLSPNEKYLLEVSDGKQEIKIL